MSAVLAGVEPAAPARVPSPPPPGALAPMRVTHVSRETADTLTVTVASESEDEVPAFQPGQFSMLWAFGIGEAPISISGDPRERASLTYTIRQVGGVTRWITERRVGESIGVRGPFGNGWPMDVAKGRDLLVVAGGIGLAPLRPAIYHVLRHRGEYGRLVVLYGARTAKDRLFKKELSAWSYLPDTTVLSTVDYDGGGWRGPIGVVTSLLDLVRLQRERTTALVCGPEVMMRFVFRQLVQRGLPEESIYLSVERSMKCGTGFCGHCQLGPLFVCKDGPVMRSDRVARYLPVPEI